MAESEGKVTYDKPMGYLLGMYPQFERTFITREVVALRELGLDIRSASLRYPSEGRIRTETEKREASKTFYIQKLSIPRIFAAQLRGFLRNPARYLSVLWFALRVSPAGLYWRTRYFIYFIEAVCLSEWAAQSGIEYIHVHIVDAQCAVAMLARRFSGLRYSVTANGPEIFDDVTELRLKEKFEHADCVVCISQFCKSQVMRWVSPDSWDKLVVIRHGVDTNKFGPRTTPPKERIGLLCVGILWPKKGQHILIEACQRLKERGLQFECVFVGQGPVRKSLEAHAEKLGVSDCVRFAGGVSEEETNAFYEAADICVSSSFAEGIPNFLMESLSKEIPAVGTNIMGLPELIEQGVEGFLVPPGDAEALANAIEKLMRDPELRVAMGKAGRKKVVRDFNLWTNTETLAVTMRRVANKE